MPRMVELIREGAAPASLMRRAARGELSLPAGEAIEILVELAANRELGAEAEQTLAGWDEKSVVEVAGNAAIPVEVLRYLLRVHAQRPAVIAALCENPTLALEELEATASQGGEEALRAMEQSARVRSSSRLLGLMAENPAAKPAQPRLTRWLAAAHENEAEKIAKNFLARHADEVKRDDSQPFALVAAFEGEDDPLQQLLSRVAKGQTVAEVPEEQEHLSILQRIGRMRVGERIKLAVRGNREERMVLIRDRSKLVSLAVLESPKVNDAEMETFAAMKNVQETVLRAIANKRNYMKNYGVLRALVNNPKTPLDVALPLLAHLLVKGPAGDGGEQERERNGAQIGCEDVPGQDRTQEGLNQHGEARAGGRSCSGAVEEGKDRCGAGAFRRLLQAELCDCRLLAAQGVPGVARQSEAARGAGRKGVSFADRGGEGQPDRHRGRLPPPRGGSGDCGRSIGAGDSGAVAAGDGRPRRGRGESSRGRGAGSDGQVHPEGAPQVRLVERAAADVATPSKKMLGVGDASRSYFGKMRINPRHCGRRKSDRRGSGHIECRQG